MGFKLGEPYGRDHICSELNAANGREHGRAVLRGPTGAIVAVVVRKDGGAKRYLNSLPGKTWEMQGRDDDRGEDLITAGAVPVFFAHDDSGYRYEGEYRCTRVLTDFGLPMYMFVRV